MAADVWLIVDQCVVAGVLFHEITSQRHMASENNLCIEAAGQEVCAENQWIMRVPPIDRSKFVHAGKVLGNL